MRANEIQPRKLVIFDIDDTLVHTQTKVHVIKDGKVLQSLNSHEFTHYKLKPGEDFDFGDFRDAREFFANAKPIIPMIDQLKQDIATGNKVVMVTARADFNDRELFLDTFRKYGVDMSKVHVYRAGNMTIKAQTEEKKKIIIRNLLDNGHYTKAIMYDDAVPNLKSFIELKDEYPRTKFYAWHVSLEGEASEYNRTNESLTPNTIHKLADQKGVKWDDEPSFLKLTKQLTGKAHLDDLDQDELKKVKQYLEKLDEGWKDMAAAGALATGLAFGGGAAHAKQDQHKPAPHKPGIHQVKKADPKLDKKVADITKQVNAPDKNTSTNGLSNNSVPEHTVQKVAMQSGIKGVELAQFMAQTRHESADFSQMKELGGDKYFHKKYDPKVAPHTAKILGNKHAGDGVKYHGRGFIQITGRDNYRMAGEALGLPLEQKPDLASKPEVAAKIAVWYWNTRVKPNVNNWNDTAEVTRTINPAMRGLEDRKEFFNNYKRIIAMK
jgi:predicted chitinase